MKINVNGINLYCEIHGSGEPLLLIEGFGYSSWMWYRQVPELSKHYQLIVFDNRGVGESDKPDVPYSIEMMADDAAGLLKALGIKKAHVLGVSMGGYIAQSLASRYPWLVRSLILCCTSFGGPKAVPMPPETMQILTDINGLTPEEILTRGMSAAFTEEYFQANPGEIKKIVGWRLANPQPLYARRHQWNAVARADLEEDTKKITAPTLIMTGTNDRVVPAENSRKIAQMIAGSRLVEFPGQGHLFFIEKAGEFNQEVLTFLGRHPITVKV